MRQNHIIALLEIHAITAAPSFDGFPPFFQSTWIEHQFLLFPQGNHFLQHQFHVAHNRHVDFHAFGDARWVYVNVDDFFRRGQEFAWHRNHAVVETRAHCHHHVGFLHGQIGFVKTVHAQHANELAIGRIVCAQAHQSACGWRTQQFHQFGQLSRRIAQYHTTTEVNQWAFGTCQYLQSFFDLTRVAFGCRLIRANKHFFWIAEFRHRLGNVFRNINHHRTRATRFGNVKGFFNGFGQLGNVGYQEVVLHTRTAHAHHIDFLEGI